MRALLIATGIVLGVPSLNALAQTDLQRAQNLATCLAGRYPNLCKRQWLSADELRKVEIAERRENLKTCLVGRYPNLCNRSKLTPDEVQQVVAAEKRENLKTCLLGRYKNLCKKHLLTQEELKQVLAAERAENLKTCLAGHYSNLCDRSLLTPEQLTQVQAAESRSAQARREYAAKAPPVRARRFGASGCESGHWVQSVSGNGEIVQLEDGSIWQVDAVDAIDTMLWLPTTEIVVCDGKLINTDDNESVDAIRIR
jgi:hypothetical protein